ncbi:hypothetical protein GW846_02915 [Candidatus Gracilibacteria bacterium]|nr:hypothetical protein [Candidatus Gracilibacteria bacterium]
MTLNYRIGFNVTPISKRIAAKISYAKKGETADQARRRISRSNPGCMITPCKRDFGPIVNRKYSGILFPKKIFSESTTHREFLDVHAFM